MKKLFLILFTLATAFAASAKDMPKVQDKEENANAIDEAYLNVTFAQASINGGGTKDLKLNIWKGKGEDAQPVVLFVHGGAWVSGDNNLEKSGSEQIRALMQLRDKGITIAAATYRFSNEAIFPAQIHDVKAAIRFLKANAQKYGIDPTRIMTMEESAGAQLALLAAVSNGEEALEGSIGGNTDVDSKVIGCVDCYGMTNFLTLASDLYARKDLGIINDQRDIRVPSAQAIKMYEALYDAGVEMKKQLNCSLSEYLHRTY